MIDSIREKLLSYALGEGDPEWRQEVESLLQHDSAHQKIWEQLLPTRRALEMTKAAKLNDAPRNLSQRTLLLVEYSKRMNPPAATPHGKRDFLQDVFAPHNIPLPGGVPLQGTAWKDATPRESSSGSPRPTPRSQHEKAVLPRSRSSNSTGRVIPPKRRPPVRAAVAPASSDLHALDVLVLSGLVMLWVPILLLAVTSNRHESPTGPSGGSLYQFSQGLFGGIEPASYRTSTLPKISVETIPPIGSSDKKGRTNFASVPESSPMRWEPASTSETTAPLYAVENYSTPLQKSSSGLPPSSPSSHSVSTGPSSRNATPPFVGSPPPSSRMEQNRSSFVPVTGRLPAPSQSNRPLYRTNSGTPIFFLDGTP